MPFLDIILIGLATWRLSLFVTAERGPWGLMVVIREQFGITHDEFGEVVSNPPGGIGKLLACHWCFSLWAAILLFGIGLWSMFPVMVLAVWGIAGILQGLVMGRD